MENVIEIEFDLKEFMSKKRIRENDIVNAMRLIWSLCCENDTCKSCPLRVDGKCQLHHLKRSDVIDKVKRNIDTALYNNHMDKVAKMLGVELGEKFIAVRENNVQWYAVLDQEGLHVGSSSDTSPDMLEELLVGDSYVLKYTPEGAE